MRDVPRFTGGLKQLGVCQEPEYRRARAAGAASDDLLLNLRCFETAWEN